MSKYASHTYESSTYITPRAGGPRVIKGSRVNAACDTDFDM